MNYDVVTIGDIMHDTFIFPSLEEMQPPVDGLCINPKYKNEKFLIFGEGEKITISDIYIDLGGSACNVATGLTKMGLKAGIISAIGNDNVASEMKTILKKNKVDTSLVSEKNKKSSFSIALSYKGERTIFAYHSFGPNDFTIPKNLNSDWLYIGPLGEDYKSFYSKITALASEKNIKIALNPGSVQIHDGLRSFGALLRVIKIIFLNREEAQELTGSTGTTPVKEMALSIRKEGPEIVIITDGTEGAYVSYENRFLKIGSYPGTRVESTGAGDAFATGFLAAYLKNEEMLTCLKWGVTNSASVIQKYGAQQGLLTCSVTKKRVDEFRWPAESLRFS